MSISSGETDHPADIYPGGILRKHFRLIVPFAVAIGVFAIAATATSASTGWHYGGVTGFVSANGIGPLPPAPDSIGLSGGGADLSDGFTAAPGGIEGLFVKGNETYNASGTTTVVDFTLPPGVTVHNDAVDCLGGPGNYCIGWDTNCNDTAGVTVNGNTIEFKFACAVDQGFEWGAELDSLISIDGLYDTSYQFKVGVIRRAKGGNMWQIKDPQSFCVGSACT